MVQEELFTFLGNFPLPPTFSASSRVESWRSGKNFYLRVPLLNSYIRFSRIRLPDLLLPVAFTTPAWPPGIVSSEVPGLPWSS